jgi:hypothetical protein
MSVHVKTDTVLSGDAPNDAAQITRALRSGHIYTAIDGWATPPSFSFEVTNASGRASAGDELRTGGHATIHVTSNAPDGYTTVVWKDGERLTSRAEREFEIDGGEGPAVFRATIERPGQPGAPPWIIGNPVFVRGGRPADTDGDDRASADTVRPPAAGAPVLFNGRTLTGWSTEADRSSMAALDLAPRVDGAEVRLRYALSGGSDVGQFAGATVDTPNGVADYRRVTFTIRAEHPMRVSIQVRAEVANSAPERWARSIYIDAQDRVRSVEFDDMTPVGPTHTPRAPAASVRTLMFIVDTTNTAPHASGRIWIRNVRLEK